MDHIAKAFNTAADQLTTGIAECNAAIDEAEARKASFHKTLATLEVESRKMLERERDAEKLRVKPKECQAAYNEFNYATWCNLDTGHDGWHTDGEVRWRTVGTV